MKQTFIGIVFAVTLIFFINCTFHHKTLFSIEDSSTLETILTKASEYCSQLNELSVSFVCIEKTSEKKSYSLSREDPKSRPDNWLSHSNPPVINLHKRGKNVFVFEYQFARKNYHIAEKRILLEENGQKKHLENARIQTNYYGYEHVLFKPIVFLSESFQSEYEFKLIKEDNYKGERAYIIKAISSSPQTSTITNGKIWICQSDFSILKMEWEQTSVKNYGGTAIIAMSLHALPNFKFSAEFNTEHNGIRFPTQFRFKELYVFKRGGKRYLRTDLAVKYEDLQFLSTETHQLAK